MGTGTGFTDGLAGQPKIPADCRANLNLLRTLFRGKPLPQTKLRWFIRHLMSCPACLVTFNQLDDSRERRLDWEQILDQWRAVNHSN